MYISYIAAELEREKAMRVFVFPRLKAQGKITDVEAQTRLSRLDAAIGLCDTLMDHGIRQTDELPLRLITAPEIKTGEESAPKPINIKGGAQ